MTNLCNPNLRIRDIRKIIGYKYHLIQWDQGIEKDSEWVFASLESEVYEEKLLSWLKSKNISLSCESLLVDPNWTKIQRLTWEKILSNPEHYFGESDFQLYQIDLDWVLEYKALPVVRFGRFFNAALVH